MIPQVVTSLTSGYSAPVNFDIMRNPFNIGIGATVVGTANYTIQHTFDDAMNKAPSACTWFNYDSASLNSASTNQDGNYSFPVRASRVVVNSLTLATNTMVKVTYIQAGLLGG